MKWLLILILAMGCNHVERKDLPEVKMFLEKASLEERAYIVSCLDHYWFETCLREYNDFKHAPKVLPCPTSKEGTGTSILKTAAGTALGIGAIGVAKKLLK